jgi:hypothetical protein
MCFGAMVIRESGTPLPAGTTFRQTAVGNDHGLEQMLRPEPWKDGLLRTMEQSGYPDLRGAPEDKPSRAPLQRRLPCLFFFGSARSLIQKSKFPWGLTKPSIAVMRQRNRDTGFTLKAREDDSSGAVPSFDAGKLPYAEQMGGRQPSPQRP